MTSVEPSFEAILPFTSMAMRDTDHYQGILPLANRAAYEAAANGPIGGKDTDEKRRRWAASANLYGTNAPILGAFIMFHALEKMGLIPDDFDMEAFRQSLAEIHEEGDY